MHRYSQLIQAETGDVIKQSVRCNQVVTGNDQILNLADLFAAAVVHRLVQDVFLGGLAAAAVRKPTVAQYTRYFRYLGVAAFAQDCGSYGEAPRHEMIAMLGNFPEKGGSMRERRVRKSLKRHNLSSASFPKRLLLGRVCYSSCSFAVALLP